ncbi:hypothetical protein ITI46_34285 [Streptomyces oryzae]|uniref:CofH/MqnC-like C-terminal domain-containing protein n=1 Tax=Streptomyces oryzae TaxID=1434886 RepID=A0ABS3XMX7_9ACTN|nr:hypothetical protein [Streptomyces oryzae]MBO8196660.1 hypothetical protein [Streptomyces oryzae]
MDAADIERKAGSGERLTREDGIALYGCDDLAWLGGLAHQVRTRHSGDTVYFAAHRSLDVAAGTDVEEAVALATGAAADGSLELRLTTDAGTDWSGLPHTVRELRAALPDGVELSACAMHYGGAGASVDPAACVEQVLRLRELQDETGGFRLFVPLLQDGPRGATGAEVLKTFAVARLLFDNVAHVAADWALHTPQTAQLALQHGADELAGQVADDAGEAGQPADALTREDLLDLIRDTGFRPAERDTRHTVLHAHEGPDPERRETPQPMRV